MTPAIRWAAIRAILIFHNCEGQNHKTVSTEHTFWSEKRTEADSNRGPSACQPNALPLGQTGSLNLVSVRKRKKKAGTDLMAISMQHRWNCAEQMLCPCCTRWACRCLVALWLHWAQTALKSPYVVLAAATPPRQQRVLSDSFHIRFCNSGVDKSGQSYLAS